MLNFAVALANTHATASKSGLDELPTPAALTELVDAWSYTGRFDRDEAELAEVHAARDQIRAAWSLDRDAAAHEANRMLREGGAVPFLVRHEPLDWHLHVAADEAPLAIRMQVEMGLALADVVRTDEMGRMRVCEAPDCTGLLLDLSRNASKRFCSVRCGNRMNQVAYRARA